MSISKPKNIAASVKQKLLSLAQQRQEDFNRLLIRYIHERLLYRLSRSEHRERFVLKGATLFTLWEGAPHRATKDLDLLGYGAPDAQRLTMIFADLCQLGVEDDGLQFMADTIQADAIREDAVYDGIRLRIGVRLGTARTQLQIDIGFGDSAYPTPALSQFPTLLTQPAPHLRAYARDTVVAEKLQVMIELGMLNSRMKDFFDIWHLARTSAFEAETLVRAVRATFERRQTAIPADTPPAFTEAFAADPSKALQWTAFVRRAGVEARARTLSEVVEAQRKFLLPILQSIIDGHRTIAYWPPGGPWEDCGAKSDGF